MVLSLPPSVKAAEEEQAGEEEISTFSVADPNFNSFLSESQLLVLRGMISKLSPFQHYIVLPYVQTDYINWWLFVFDKVEVEYYVNSISGFSFPAGCRVYHVRLQEKSEIFDFTNLSSYMSITFNDYEPYASLRLKTPFTFLDGWVFSGAREGYPSYDTYFGSSIFTDLGYLPDIRERGGADYDHATAVILASFLLFFVFRSMWRSIRGRVD